MNYSGYDIIQSVCKRLDFLNLENTDNNIVRIFRSLDRYELNQLITFGTIDHWLNDYNKKNNQTKQQEDKK